MSIKGFFVFSTFLLFGVCDCFGQGLFGAIRSGDLKSVKKIIQQYPDSINAKSEQQFNPLMVACYRGQSKIAIWLIRSGAELNAFSPEGTALQAAVYKNELKIAKALIAKNAALNTASPDGNNALIYAVLNGNVQLVKLLVNAGADQSFKNKDGQTALSLAESMQQPKIIDCLDKK